MRWFACVVLGWLIFALPASSAPVAMPKVLERGYSLSLFAAEPDIVTPVNLTFDGRGRLLVIESHTHFRPKGYKGPPADRVRVLEDTDGDGRADRFTTFFEGTRATMSLASHPDGSIYLATRQKILRLRDTDKDGKADRVQTIARLETRGNYPHNGLCGLVVDGKDRLYFGLGENLGKPYKLIAGDITLSGGGEGGNIYRCRADGSGLERIATGFWNPFGICLDPQSRLFTVDNDPDSRPPCRLLHVVGGGDFGYQFRYGRSGLHPLQAWDGELPGTLPMVAGTGEGPCAVLPYRGDLWVTSWGDYRVERFTLKAVGASWRAARRTVVQGDKNFRPGGLALAPDGSLYFTDWVDRSYPLHRKGRVWRLAPTGKAAKPHAFPALTQAEKRARQLEQHPNHKALEDTDPFVSQAAVWGLIRKGNVSEVDWKGLSTARQRLGVLQALRWKNQAADTVLPDALRDPHPDVRLLALRWVADGRMQKYRKQVLQQFQHRAGTFALYRAALATLPWLDHGKVTPGRGKQSNEKLFSSILEDANNPLALRVWALRSLPTDHPALSQETLGAFIKEGQPALQREALRTLALSTRPERFGLLARVASNHSAPVSLRADAVMGLAGDARNEKLLKTLLVSKHPTLRTEARRSLRNADPGYLAALKDKKPDAADVAGWLKALAGPGDADAGRRVFFRANGPGCARCHTYAGRGAAPEGQAPGPDLTRIGEQGKRRVVESILQPSREIAPHFRTWRIETRRGRVYVGASLGQFDGGRKERFVNSEGKTFVLPVVDMVFRQPSPKSVMPEGLEKTMTLAEFRDLMAFLLRR